MGKERKEPFIERGGAKPKVEPEGTGQAITKQDFSHGAESA
jgi:hypothetical protein